MVGKLQSLKPGCAARRAVSFSSTSTSLTVPPPAICSANAHMFQQQVFVVFRSHDQVLHLTTAVPTCNP